MIYLMPIDECSHCGARTPRIFNHHCSKQEAGGRVGTEPAAELQSWIASQLAASSARSRPYTLLPRDLRGAIRREPGLSAAAKNHLITLPRWLRRSSHSLPGTASPGVTSGRVRGAGSYASSGRRGRQLLRRVLR